MFLYKRELSTTIIKAIIDFANCDGGKIIIGVDDDLTVVGIEDTDDAKLIIENLERYDDREDIRTNLLESYDRLIEFLKK